MISGFRIAAILYLLFNGISFAYHAGKGEWVPHFKRPELILSAIFYTALASLIVILP